MSDPANQPTKRPTVPLTLTVADVEHIRAIIAEAIAEHKRRENEAFMNSLEDVIGRLVPHSPPSAKFSSGDGKMCTNPSSISPTE